jgi:F-type H+-transporting ATPase subunit b
MELFQDSSIWVLLSFIVFLGILWVFGRDKFLALLDGKIEEIKKEIETAESLRVESQELLAQYQRKQRDAAKEAEQILETAKKHAAEIKKEAEKELKESMKRREQQLEERIQRMQDSAMQDIRSHAADLALQATTEIITDKLDKKDNEKLVQQSIKNVAGQLN